MAKAKSSQVVVFPAALRTYVASSDIKTGAKFTTENNISGIVRSVTDSESYLISPRAVSNSYDFLEFVIHGYYFKVDASDLILTGNLFAGIRLDASGRLINYDNDSPVLDDSTNFTGLEFSQTDNFPGDAYYLQLFKNGQPCIDSLVKIDATSLGYSNGSESVSVFDKLDELDTNVDTIEGRFNNGVLKVSNGGTGSSTSSKASPANIWVNYAKYAQKLVGTDANNTPYSVGGPNQVTYFNDGIPTAGMHILSGTTNPDSN
ncbi:MAG: hypothetical protein IJH34_12090, partial [Romboutsia sp.]|nr:hypothetical protein [Romboutsia sp.]